MAVKKTGKLSYQEEFEKRDLDFKKEDPFPDNDELVIQSIRLHKTRLEALKKYFKRKGTDLSHGIRTLLYEWMDKTDLR